MNDPDARSALDGFIKGKLAFNLRWYSCSALTSNNAIGSAVFYLLFVGYEFYCFNVAQLAFRASPDKTLIRTSCMDGIYKELKNMYEGTYSGVGFYEEKYEIQPDFSILDSIEQIINDQSWLYFIDFNSKWTNDRRYDSRDTTKIVSISREVRCLCVCASDRERRQVEVLSSGTSPKLKHG